jgi:hypothetical protein
MNLRPTHIILAIFFLLSFTATQCKKEDEYQKLPPETLDRANIFGCLVNGDVFRYPANTSGRPSLGWNPGGGPRLTADYNRSADVLTIRVRSKVLGKNERTASFILTVCNPRVNVKNEFQNISFTDGERTYSASGGEFLLTRFEFDTLFSPAQAIVNGTFACDISPSIKITQGRFAVGSLTVSE